MTATLKKKLTIGFCILKPVSSFKTGSQLTALLSMLPTFHHCQEIHSMFFMHHTVLTDRDIKSESHLPVKFSYFVNFFNRYLGLDSFPR